LEYVSTRGQGQPARFGTAVIQGMATDGGLFVPKKLPRLDTAALAGLYRTEADLPKLAQALLAPFVQPDVSAATLIEVTKRAFNFPLPLSPLSEGARLLELFHGPTAAFKDVGARFLAAVLPHIWPKSIKGKPLILVATSGDTGGAVAGAFYDQNFADVMILYPEGRVSPRQERQLASWGSAVKAFAIKGDFDTCQALVKQAFADTRLRAERPLLSANSINLGRLLPQQVYYAKAWLEMRQLGLGDTGFIIPTGNLGNAVAAMLLREAGLPIRDIVLATNANTTLADYWRTGVWQPSSTVPTLANAMDVGAPSNAERMLHLYPDWKAWHRFIGVTKAGDEDIKRVIAAGEKRYGHVFCPHTATAVHAFEAAPPGRRPYVVVSTAHPAKFETIVEPLVGHPVAVPAGLAAILNKKPQLRTLTPSYGDLRDAIASKG